MNPSVSLGFRVQGLGFRVSLTALQELSIISSKDL